ncbi:MAG: cytochrome b N-terminal domain-containing protein [Desulfuromonas sp.]|nr:cytochrome b N-terminal domain-containing protein [Desulfuromonas sp.]
MFEDFLSHLFPRMVLEKNLRIRYTFCLGGMAFTLFLLLAVSGLLLAMYYQPHSEHAYASILYIEEQVFGGHFLHSLHRTASNFYLALIFLHTLRVLLTGAYRKPREVNWLIGFMLLCLALFSGYTGYLLPMDQLALWATQTGMELLRVIPLGETLFNILVPDAVGEPLSLLRFYVLHVVVLPMLTVSLCFLHFYKIRKQKGALPYL